jgi:hypothetical protein
MNALFVKEFMVYYRAPKLFQRTFSFAFFIALFLFIVVGINTFFQGPWLLLNKHILTVLLVIVTLIPTRILSTADTIVGEKEHNTYPSLVVSTLSPLQLLLGKMSYLVFQMTLFQLQVLPLLVISSLFGGYSLRFLFFFYLVLFFHNCFLVALHLYFASIPLSKLNNRWNQFYSTYGLQKNMASSMSTLMCLFPFIFVFMFWTSTLGRSSAFATFSHSPFLLNLKMLTSFSPALVLFFDSPLPFLGRQIPLSVLSLFLNFFFTLHLILSTEPYHRTIENDKSCRFRWSLWGLLIVLEFLGISALFLHGSLGAQLLFFPFSFFILLYLSFKTGNRGFQPWEEPLTFKERFRLNLHFLFWFRGFKSTSPSYTLLLSFTSLLLYLFFLYHHFGILYSFSYLSAVFSIFLLSFFCIFGFSHYLSSLKGEVPSSAFALATLLFLFYALTAYLPLGISSLARFLPDGSLWLNFLYFMAYFLIFMNPFALNFRSFSQFETLTLPSYPFRKLEALFPHYFLYLGSFLLSYFLIGLLFYSLGNRKYQKRYQERPPLPTPSPSIKVEASTPPPSFPL